MHVDDFVRTVAEELDLDSPQALTPATDLVLELGLDSFQVFELVMVIEVLAGCDDPPADPPEIRTFQDAFEHYERLCASV